VNVWFEGFFVSGGLKQFFKSFRECQFSWLAIGCEVCPNLTSN
jgi:hypothetical protein